MRLQDGQLAPYFERKDIDGNTVCLNDYAGKKVLVCFFRYAGCPWCNLTIHKLTLEYPKFQKAGLSIIAFIQSEQGSIEEYIKDRHDPSPPFPLIADPEREIYNLYGVEDSSLAAIKTLAQLPAFIEASTKHPFKQGKVDGSLTLLPAHFMISDIPQTVYKSNYGADYYNPINMIDIYDFAQFGGK